MESKHIVNFASFVYTVCNLLDAKVEIFCFICYAAKMLLVKARTRSTLHSNKVEDLCPDKNIN